MFLTVPELEPPVLPEPEKPQAVPELRAPSLTEPQEPPVLRQPLAPPVRPEPQREFLEPSKPLVRPPSRP